MNSKRIARIARSLATMQALAESTTDMTSDRQPIPVALLADWLDADEDELVAILAEIEADLIESGYYGPDEETDYRENLAQAMATGEFVTFWQGLDRLAQLPEFIAGPLPEILRLASEILEKE